MTGETLQRRQRISFGDFQTPHSLADEVCSLLQARGYKPSSILEPTCGRGNFLLAAADSFPAASQIIGSEINDHHLSEAAHRIRDRSDVARFRLTQGNFFNADWTSALAALPEPILIIGNPPWVTSATQGSLGSDNLPIKANSGQLRGIDAITGQANFDVSEWILARLFDGLNGRRGCIAMLCKTAVARRVLAYAWQRHYQIATVDLHEIDSKSEFKAAVNACLLIVDFAAGAICDTAFVFPVSRPLSRRDPAARIGWKDGQLIADLDSYTRQNHLRADLATRMPSNPTSTHPLWRSGVKHDCAAVMELVERNGRFINGLDEEVEVETEHLFPLLKSGDIARGNATRPRRWLIMPQRFVGEDTAKLEQTAPGLWQYLSRHATRLDARRSSIYRRQPRFAIFGVGEYTFAPWKIAVSGLAKRLHFSVVEPNHGQPCMLDDASYFLPCLTQEEATNWASALNSSASVEFFSAFIFWDAKRPVTAELLRKLDLSALLNGIFAS